MPRRVLSIVLLLVSASCSRISSETPQASGWGVSFRGGKPSPTEIWVSVATTPQDREHGLMGVTDLPEDSGMAFVWDEPVTTTFWMKDTLIPLSIAFVDARGRIITIRDMQPCHADPCPTYGASGPFVMAVETSIGFFERFSIEVGDQAELLQGSS